MAICGCWVTASDCSQVLAQARGEDMVQDMDRSVGARRFKCCTRLHADHASRLNSADLPVGNVIIGDAFQDNVLPFKPGERRLH